MIHWGHWVSFISLTDCSSQQNSLQTSCWSKVSQHAATCSVSIQTYSIQLQSSNPSNVLIISQFMEEPIFRFLSPVEQEDDFAPRLRRRRRRIGAVGQPVVIRRIYFSPPAAAEWRTRCDACLLGCQTQQDVSHTGGNHSREQLYHCREETSHSSLQLDGS